MDMDFELESELVDLAAGESKAKVSKTGIGKGKGTWRGSDSAEQQGASQARPSQEEGGGDGDRQRRARAPTSRRELLDELVMVEAKLSLATAQQVRASAPGSSVVVLVQKDAEVHGAVHAGTRRFARLTEGKSKHGQGQPAYFACKCFCQYLRKKVSPEQATTIDNFIAEMGSNLRKWMCVSQCSCKETYEKEQWRLTLGVKHEVVQTLLDILEAQGHVVCHGGAPRWNLERKAQTLLDKISKAK